MLETNCPACLSTHINPLSPYRFWQDGGDHLPMDYQLLVCSTCELWFKDNLPSKESLKRHYESLNAEASAWNYSDRWPHERKLDSILLKLTDCSKVLDVGCWTGRLLSPHHKRLELYGIEPNASAAETAKQNGLHILGSYVDENISSFGPFDCITMIDVFEHLREPMQTLHYLVSALAPGGKLLIVTGRTNCFPVWIAGSSYWYFSCPDHLVFLNQRFVTWVQEKIPNVRVNFSAVRHFDFDLLKFLSEFIWLLCWRFLSPHSPFTKPTLSHLPGFKRFTRLQKPLLCGMWKDHALIEINKST